MHYEHSDKRRYLAVLNGEITDRVPIHETVINGRYIEHATGRSDCTILALEPAEFAVPVYRKIGIDMATLPFFWRPERLNTWDQLREAPFAPYDDFLRRVDEYAEFLSGQPTGLLVYVHGPLDSTYLSMGYTEFFMAAKLDPDLVEAIMDRFTEYHLGLVRELVQRPVDVIQIVDDIAMKTGTFIDPAIQREWWLPRMRSLIEPIQSAGIPLQFHSDGDVECFMQDVIDLGFKSVNPIDPTCNEAARVKQRWGDRITLMGNMDIAGTLAFGTPAQVREEMSQLLEMMMPNGRYIAMTGSSLSDGVVPENYDAMVETVLHEGRYPQKDR